MTVWQRLSKFAWSWKLPLAVMVAFSGLSIATVLFVWSYRPFPMVASLLINGVPLAAVPIVFLTACGTTVYRDHQSAHPRPIRNRQLLTGLGTGCLLAVLAPLLCGLCILLVSGGSYLWHAITVG